MRPALLSAVLFFIARVFSAASSAGGEYEIVVPDREGELAFPPGDGYRYPAEFLKSHILLATGKTFPIVAESAATPGTRKIHVGATAVARERCGDFSAFRPEEFAIVPHGEDLILCGEVTREGVDRGTLFGVYEFLERQLGFRWFWPSDRLWNALGGGTVFRKNAELAFPAVEFRSFPRFRRREGGISYYYQSVDIQKKWHPVLRFGSSMPHENANHTQIGWVDLYGETHPEYFAKDKQGKPRINTRLKHRTYICPSNPATLERMLENIVRLDAGEDLGNAWGPRPPTKDCVYFAFNDGMIPETTCHCAACFGMLELNRNYEARGTELIFGFVSRYASAVRERWPNRRLATLAYSHYLAPPEKAVIPENVDIAYVGPKMQYANAPAVFDAHRERVRRWSELFGGERMRLGGWMNIVNPAINVSSVPFMYPKTLKKWLLATEGEISGYFINGLNPYLRRQGEAALYGAIQSFPMVYLQSRLLWDPDADADAMLEDCCDGLYGAAGPDMLAIYRKIIERWENYFQSGDASGELDFIHRIRYPRGEVDWLKERLDDAVRKAEGDSDAARRLSFLRDHVFSRFFGESDRYHAKSGAVASYECPATIVPPVIDGSDEDAAWRESPPLALSKYRWGVEAARKTEVRLLHDGERLYFLAELRDPVPGGDFRIQSAVKMDALHEKYSPNINRAWEPFLELRVLADGALQTFGPFPRSEIKTLGTPEKLVIEGAIPYTSLLQGGKNMPTLRLQFLRYDGVWDDYDTWSPTLGGRTDYPTWRFGVVHPMPAGKKSGDGLE